MAKRKRGGIVGYPPLDNEQEGIGPGTEAAMSKYAREENERREARRLKALETTRANRPTWETSLTEEVKLPMEFLAALSSGRSVMLMGFNRQLTLEESVAVANGFRVMIDTMDRMKREILDYDGRLEEIEGDAKIAIEDLGKLVGRMESVAKQCFIPKSKREGDR